jgi:hypothetical protein
MVLPAFLVALGQADEAVELVKERARENAEDLPSQIVHGIFLYLARRFDAAVFALALAEAMNGRQWLTRTASALVALAKMNPPPRTSYWCISLLGMKFSPAFYRYAWPNRSGSESRPSNGARATATPATRCLRRCTRRSMNSSIRFPHRPRSLPQLMERSQRQYVAPIN